MTFGALLVIILTIIRWIIVIIKADQEENGESCCVLVCLTILHCIFDGLEFLVKILNHNAVIIMAVTGEGYCDSAKTALALILVNL